MLYEGDENNFILEVIIRYFGAQPLELIEIVGEKYHRPINKTLKHKQSISFSLENLPNEVYASLAEDLLPLEFEMIATERREGESPESNLIYQSIKRGFQIRLP